ncbi:unnamed protein product [Ambrosiozyma monospora]|uniref:Unnamed protein product n=1 Tax=Ambrosiozyma monospora TaxID=43982 RepID=A0ACB5UB92_AMBMO|nr:unnamed protein product [Ambrosiozyma monospora]
MSFSNGKISTAQFDLQPSEGLSNIKLAESLYQTLLKLKSNKLDNDIHFIYSHDSPIIILQLLKYNINFTYDTCLQKLLVIEINLKDKPDYLTFKSEGISGYDFKTLYNKIFGPTYPVA